ncbi:CG31235, partial [Drosophila busckii]
LVYCREYMQGGQFTKQTDESGKVVIVTGSNTGIGKETALELARRGATVYLACRDKQRAELARKFIIKETQNKNVYFLELDLSSLESVRQFVVKFKQQQSQLHVLINNAGICYAPKGRTKDGFELHLGVNHLGHFLLTILLLDLLKKSTPSRIVNVSSMMHAYAKLDRDDLQSDKSYNPIEAYSRSKLANVLFTRELAKHLAGTRVTVNALHPGVVDTEILREFTLAQTTFVKTFLKPLFRPFVKTAKSGAQTTLYVALSPELEQQSGLYFSDCKPRELAAAGMDDQLAQWLWAESIKLTQAPTE